MMAAGVPITTYCDAHKLTMPERLELFVQVCGGVQHAQNQNLEVKVTTIFLQLQQVADSDLPTSLYSKRVTVPAVRLIQLVYGLGVKNRAASAWRGATKRSMIIGWCIA
jgi:hypothetical protein